MEEKKGNEEDVSFSRREKIGCVTLIISFCVLLPLSIIGTQWSDLFPDTLTMAFGGGFIILMWVSIFIVCDIKIKSLKNFIRSPIKSLYPSPSIPVFTRRMKAVIVAWLALFLWALAWRYLKEWPCIPWDEYIYFTVAALFITYLCLRKNVWGYLATGMVGSVCFLGFLIYNIFFAQGPWSLIRYLEIGGLILSLLVLLLTLWAHENMDIPDEIILSLLGKHNHKSKE